MALVVVQLIFDRTGEESIFVFLRDNQGVEAVTLHERMGALVALSIFRFGKRGFGCHADLLTKNAVME